MFTYPHTLQGVTLLTAASNFGSGAGISPVGKYAGFIVGQGGATFHAGTVHGNYADQFVSAAGVDITGVSLTPGQFYPIWLEQARITAGSILLVHAW